MAQLTLSDLEYSNRKKKTKRELFLDRMDAILPWQDWVELVQPFYPAGKRGRPPIEIETMLRMYLMRIWFRLSDKSIEDAVYDSYAMRTFMRVDFFRQQVPDATTLRRFRRLLSKHHLAERISGDVRSCLRQAGIVLHKGSIAEAYVANAGAAGSRSEKQR
ncbi:MAG: transposase [Clostridia bacterium]|nr:transposase [Clostridia bacterium]MBR0445190.1 transposase [Clostridia bacterium]